MNGRGKRCWRALVVVDMQVDFFNDPELKRCRADLVMTCNRLIDEAIARHLPVVEVRTEHAQDGSTWTLNMRDDGEGMAIAGTPGAAPVQGLRHAGTSPAVRLLIKTRDSAFHGTDLEETLRHGRVDRFLLAGVSTESCIWTTAAEAYARDFRVGVVLDATASVRWELHDQALDSLRTQYRQPALYAADAIAGMAAPAR